jgi:hypothetical protein
MFSFLFATLAQLVEHSPCKRTVVSSNLTGGSIFKKQQKMAMDCKIATELLEYLLHYISLDFNE